MGAGPGVEGPDLSVGVDLEVVPDGGMLEGHVGDESVLLLRRGSDLFAVGARCTHYGAPLKDGLFTGSDLHCPWHHASFDVKTGSVNGAPALDGLSCWNVERSGGRVVVRARKEVKPPAPKSTGPESVVIVGAGPAGNTAAEELRRQGYQGTITLVSAEDSLPVDRPNLSKDYLAGTAPEEYVTLRDRDFYRRQNIDLRTGVRATSVDSKGKKIKLSDGTTLPFGALLLATGSAPVRIDAPGDDLPHVHYLRTFADSKAIIAQAEKGRSAVVIGASFIGLEVAASLRTRQVEVRVVALEQHPFERVFGRELGDFLRSVHASRGVKFHLGQTATRIDPKRVHLDDGHTLNADLVVVGVGVRPVTDMAKAAGCKLDRGVVVNNQLETTVPGIFAAGDVARFPDARGRLVRIEHWAVAGQQGRIAARNMLGMKEPYKAVPFFWTTHYEVPINFVGSSENCDKVEVVGSLSSRDCMIAYREGGRITGVVCIGRDRDSLLAENALARRDDAALENLLKGARTRIRA